MEPCPKCGQEFTARDTYCQNCGTKVGRRHRPNGITILAVLILIVGALNLMGSFMDAPTTLLGMIISGIPATIIGLVESGVLLYCGIGFMRMSDAARKVMIGLMVYRIVNGLLILPSLEEYQVLLIPSERRIDSPMQNTISHVTGLLINALMIMFLYSIRDKFADAPEQPTE